LHILTVIIISWEKKSESSDGQLKKRSKKQYRILFTRLLTTCLVI
jgi:hypothetical protein